MRCGRSRLSGDNRLRTGTILRCHLIQIARRQPPAGLWTTAGWAFTVGSNPRHVKGLCAALAINLSGNTIPTGETCADAAPCGRS